MVDVIYPLHCKGCWRGKAQDPDQGEPFGVSQFSLPDQSR